MAIPEPDLWEVHAGGVALYGVALLAQPIPRAVWRAQPSTKTPTPLWCRQAALPTQPK